jgi:trigger factor
MTIKKALCLVLSLAMLLCVLAGCGEKGTDTETEDTESTDTETTDTDTATDTDTDSETTDSTSLSDGLDENGYFIGVKASDIVTLPEYKGITIDESVYTATEDEVNSEIDSLLSSNATYEELTDRAIVDGDTVNIDYVGSVDGVEFDGGSTQGYGTTVTIGVTSYIDDFLEQLIGHTPGENFDIEVTFPDPYENNTDLAGKDAVFNITINYIQGDAVYPELDDDFAVSQGYESVDDLKESIKTALEDDKKLDFYESLLTQATCDEVPDSVYNFVLNLNMMYIESYANMYGLSVEDFLYYMYGYEEVDDYTASISDGINTAAIEYLAVQAIAEIEGITVSVDDIAEYGYEAYVDSFGEPYIKQVILNQHLVKNFIFDNAVTE